MDGDPNGGILPNERGGFAMLSVSPDFKQNRRYVGCAITGRTATDGESTIKVRLGIGKIISKFLTELDRTAARVYFVARAG
jgi:hypothetical protein